MPINGLVTMTPTSTAKTGATSTATINANGSVTFGGCATLSLNGVFTSSYDNYFISIRMTPATDADVTFRFRASGTDDSTASSYVNQKLTANAATTAGARTTTNSGLCASNSSALAQNGISIYLFGPYLSQATAFRCQNASSYNNSYIHETAGTHNVTTSYDGITFINAGSVVSSGLITVYGFNQ